jgi:hypothetical protein
LLCSSVVLRKLKGLMLLGVLMCTPPSRAAESAALLIIGDASQLSELQLAKVMAENSSLWLSVRLRGRTRLAVVAAQSDVESAPAAHAWLRALDFTTRVRVGPPPGPLSGCTESPPFELADSGLPEPRHVPALGVSSAGSELELRRLLAEAGLPLDLNRVAQFTSEAQPPFQVLIYDVPASGGSTAALRLLDRGHPAALPKIVLSGAKALPLSLIALSTASMQPPGDSADPSEFPVVYRAPDSSTDYRAARAGWLVQNPTRWLSEVQGSAGLFAWTVFPGRGQIAPVVARYFEELSAAPEGRCEMAIVAAHARGSENAADFVCDGADDLAQSLQEVGFAELRLSRFFGMASDDGMALSVAPGVPRSPLLIATDQDLSGCPQDFLPPATTSEPPTQRPPPPVNPPPVVVDAPGDPDYGPSPSGTRVPEGSCSGTVFDSGESCGGNSRPANSSGDACSGDSSSADSSGDSCSGDSSSEDSGPESCSGDSGGTSSDGCSGDSDSSSDSSGCSKSEYDGDTCSGEGSSAAHPRPRQVRLSLLTLLAAALALPLRRLRASR